MKDPKMIEQIADRASAIKVMIFGAVGSTSAMAWLVASIKAATLLCQLIAALTGAIAGCLTIYYMIKSHRSKSQKPTIRPKLS